MLLGLVAACRPTVPDSGQFASSHATAADAAADAASDAAAADTAAGTDSAADVGCNHPCDDGNPCTDDNCLPDGGCQATHRDGPACDDGNACTVDETCAGGACLGGDKVVCDDKNPCTDDSCDPAKGCLTKANHATCDDANPCTAPDTCGEGVCRGVAHMWMATLGSANPDFGRGVAALADGGVVALGTTATNVNGDFWMARFDVYGKPMFEHVYPLPERDEEAKSIAVLADGGYLLVGRSTALNNGNDVNALLVRTDAMGNEVWKKMLGGKLVDTAAAVVPLTDGGAAFAGQTTDTDMSPDFWLVRLDAAGAVAMQAKLGTDGVDKAAALAILPGGGFVLAGQTTATGTTDVLVVRTDAKGAPLWQKQFGESGVDEANGIAAVPDGMLIVGLLLKGGGAAAMMTVRRLDGDGKLLWAKEYGSGSGDMAGAIVALADGFVVAGSSTPADTASGQGLLMRADPSGNVLWQRQIGGSGAEALVGLARLADGYVAIGGAPDPAGKTGMWVVRTDRSGLSSCASAGVCPLTTCSGSNYCAIGWCEPAKGCQTAKIAAGDPCVSAACQAGTCQGILCENQVDIDCNDGNACTQDSCKAQDGCSHAVLADGTACGGGLHCATGACVSK